MSTVELFLYDGFTPTGRLQVSQVSGTGPWTNLDLTSTLPVTDALTAWTVLAEAAFPLTDFEFAPNGAGGVQLSADVESWVQMSDTLAELLGFSATVQHLDSSVNSDLTTLGRGIFPVGYQLPAEQEDVAELSEYRDGRATAYHAGRAGETTITMIVPPDAWEAGLDESPLCSGHAAFRMTLDDAGAYAEANLDGYLDCWPHDRSPPEDDGEGSAVRVDLKCTVTDPAGSLTALQDTAWSALWGSIRYGYSVHYIARIEGVPYLLAEHVGDATAPTNYTMLAGLVIDRSGPVGSKLDPKSHFSAAFDLELRLLDSATVRGLFTRPTLFAELTADVTATATAFPVKSTAGWTSSLSALNIGTSRESAAGALLDSFTTVTRGTYGRKRSYKAGTIITDKIAVWQGRRVELFAALTDPGGRYVQTANVLDTAVKVWDGYINARPVRDGVEWVIPARDQVRRLTQPLGVAASGKASWALDDDAFRIIPLGTTVSLDIEDDTSTSYASVQVQPFIGQTNPLRMSTIRSRIADALNAAVVHADIGTMYWVPEYWPGDQSGLTLLYRLRIPITLAGTEKWVRVVARCDLNSIVWPDKGGDFRATVDTATGVLLDGLLVMKAFVTGAGLSVTLDGDAGSSDIPSAGIVLLESDGQSEYRRYTAYTTDAADSNKVHLTLSAASSSGDDISAAAADTFDGDASEVSATFFWLDTGTAPDILRRAIVSTGDAQNGAHDTLPKGQGLGLPDIDSTSFDTVFDGFFLDLNMAVGSEAGTTLEELFGGLLRLSQRGLVARRDTAGTSLDITAIHTGSADDAPVTTITDSMLVSSQGRRPARVMDVYTAPQAIAVKCRTLAVADRVAADSSISLKDPHLVDWTGERWSLDIYGVERSSIVGAAKAWGTSWFRAGESRQVVELDVPPWVDAQPGDIVEVDLADPNLWDYASGVSGLTGLARVIGAQVSLTTFVQTLTVSPDGIMSAGPMSPSLPIVAVNGPAAAPTSIDVDDAYFDLLTHAKDGDASWKVIAYRPGQDDGHSEYTVSTVTAPGGGVTRLTVTAYPAAPATTLTTSWRLTWPIEDNGTTAQAAFLHNTDVVQWS